MYKRQAVLDACNYLFAAVMGETVGDLVYTDKEALHLGADYYPEEMCIRDRSSKHYNLPSIRKSSPIGMQVTSFSGSACTILSNPRPPTGLFAPAPPMIFGAMYALSLIHI